tara:strand:+ start:1372 stop:1590 length:219 start_codon:yes stop_codon:yes gene_type:complete
MVEDAYKKKVIKKKPVVKKPVIKKKKISTKRYTLEEDVPVCGKDGIVILKKGTEKELTLEGAKYFKSKSYIK